jgi:tetratricopeptide (TPR) repeat protein
MMAATASQPRPEGQHDPSLTASAANAHSLSGGAPATPGPPVAERSLQARDSNRVYQAARDQYIYGQSPPAPAAVSNTLPRDTAAFTGRTEELRAIVDTVTGTLDRGGAIPVHAIDGMPGVGKSALAIHAGHELERYFPDGQYFINLHAHAVGQGAVLPIDALFVLLSAAGVAATQVPANLDARAALWRSRMAGRRVLLILDNAAGREQIEPLLPGAPGCLVLVTSRRRLTGLTAHHAAENLALDNLPPDQAAALFATMSGRCATGRDGDAIGQIVSLCGYLPLAICLLAARLRPERRWQVGDLVRELARSKDRLAALRADDVAVEAAFGLSYRQLPAARQRFFRRLGLHPGTDVDAFAGAALDGITPAAAQEHLDELYLDHLLDQPLLGRYRMHDLVRDYTRTLADQDPSADRAQSLARLVAYYQAGARTADGLSRPWACGSADGDTPVGEPAASSDLEPPVLPEMSTRQQAQAWMTTEQTNLFACATMLSATADHRRLVALAAAMATHVRSAGPWGQAVVLHEAAAAAARQIGDPSGHANALRDLGVVHRLSGDYAVAGDVLSHACEIYSELGDQRGTAYALTCLAGARWRAGDRPSAARHLQEALVLFESLGDPYGTADALNELGVVRYMDGDHLGAVEALRQAQVLHRDLGNPQGQATALTQFGCAQQLTGEYASVVEAYRQALAIYEDLGDRYGRARALNYLGYVLSQVGDYPGAYAALDEALALHRDLGYRPGEANALLYLGIVHCRTRDLGSAERSLHEALALYRDLGSKAEYADALNNIGVLRRLTGDYEGAADAHAQALGMYRQLADELGQAEVQNCLGALQLARERPRQALDHYRRALRLARRAHNPREEAAAIEGSGLCAFRLGDRTAVGKLRKARAAYQRIGAVDAARIVDELIGSLGEAG